MNIIMLIVVGAIAGWLAHWFMKGRGVGIMNIIWGIAGAFIGSYLFDFLQIRTTGLIGSIIEATIGAILLLYLISFLRRKF